jgi:hypothetical protein
MDLTGVCAKPSVVKGPSWGGYSVGQTRIFRRDVFEALRQAVPVGSTRRGLD